MRREIQTRIARDTNRAVRIQLFPLSQLRHATFREQGCTGLISENAEAAHHKQGDSGRIKFTTNLAGPIDRGALERCRSSGRNATCSHTESKQQHMQRSHFVCSGLLLAFFWSTAPSTPAYFPFVSIMRSLKRHLSIGYFKKTPIQTSNSVRTFYGNLYLRISPYPSVKARPPSPGSAVPERKST